MRHHVVQPRRVRSSVEPRTRDARSSRASTDLQTLADNSTRGTTAVAMQALADRGHRSNTTGLPDALKAGVENLSGLAMDDVKVHYNSAKPAQFKALATTQGSEIHIGPGQEKHLAHEAWHVVQQKQGRVAPTTQMKGIHVNDDDSLEREADTMGAKASAAPQRATTLAAAPSRPAAAGAPIQLNHDKSELTKVIQELYKTNQTPKESDFVEALKGYVKDQGGDAEKILNDSSFAWDLMELVGEESGKKLHEAITSATGIKPNLMAKFSPAYKAKWTIRHYTKSEDPDKDPPYVKIKNTVDLLVSGILDKSSNTSDKDWYSIGNTGFGFFLLSIGGVVPARTFLAKATHYAEFDFDTLPSVFASGDMLGQVDKGSKPEAYKGTGAEVKIALCNAIPAAEPAKFLQALDSRFTNFEVKVPGMQTVTKWHKK